MSRGGFIAGSERPEIITKADVGLGNVDNTSDSSKPVSTAQQTALDLKLDKTRFSVFNNLPGLPVLDVALGLVPGLSVSSIDSTSGVYKLTDPLTGIELTQTVAAQRPKMAVDSSGRTYIKFRNSRVFSDGVTAANLAGANGNTTTFMFVANTTTLKSNSNFQWSPALGNGFDNNNRIGVHLPWGSGDLFVDHGSVSGGRLQVSGITNTFGQIVSYLYVRDGSTAKLYKNGTLVKTTTGLTATLSSASGRFILGDSVVSQQGQEADMDFYGLFFYGRALNAEEIQKMFLFSKKLYGV